MADTRAQTDTARSTRNADTQVNRTEHVPGPDSAGTQHHVLTTPHSDHPTIGTADAGDQIITAANVITVLRLILVPLAFSVLVNRGHDLLAFALFAVAGLSDGLDGMIARRTNTVTQLGQAIDPLVDRFLIAAGVIGLYVVGRVPTWILVVLIARDCVLLIGLAVLRKVRADSVHVLFIGKATTVAVLVGFAGLIANVPHADGLGLITSGVLPGFSTGSYCVWIWFVYLGLVLSLMTMCAYFVMGIRAIRSANRRRQAQAVGE
ncbi:MAG: CDP-alcohol phosphatidyltransferase family protein [Actinomycetes bacterium]|jgi:cardiolipin synthase|nr:CDP-alcohol phosphatidyltransferase family protein [Actinomycetes bacterium]